VQGTGLDAEHLAQIHSRMQAAVDDGRVSGIVTLVQRHGKLAWLDAAGYQDVEAKKAMPKDAIFQIMSMTKPFTGVAIMMLAEEGKLSVNDAVEVHLPEFRGQMMIEKKDGDHITVTKPPRRITIRDLMSHTSGMISDPPPGLNELLERMDRTLAEAVLAYSQQPLMFAPGTKWSYSNPGIATLGRIVEVASGMPFEKFIAERIFKPLEMTDSFVMLAPERVHARIATLYVDREDGKLELAGADMLAGDAMKFRKGARYAGPEYSIYSTAVDLSHFYQMMLDNGTWGGRRLLSRASVEYMTAVHTGELKAGHTDGMGFGLTWEVVKDAAGAPTLLSPGSFGHGGAFGTYGVIDRKKDMVLVFLVQGGAIERVRKAFLQIAETAVRE
jgi:CubicO group peptidase (beta-lactamase class C family)